MPNTIAQRTLVGSAKSKNVVKLINIISDGSQETDLVVYDNSAFVADVSKGNLKKIHVSGYSASGKLRLEWDQTTDSHIVSFNPSGLSSLDFCDYGGIPNPNDTGATGDIVLTTVGLANLDEITIILEIEQN